MVRRVSTTPALLREKFGEGMKALTTVRGDDVMCGSQLVSLDVFRTGGKNTSSWEYIWKSHKVKADTVEPTGSVSVLRGVNREMLRWEMGGADRDKWIEETVEEWMMFLRGKTQQNE